MQKDNAQDSYNKKTSKHFPLVDVMHNGKKMFIHKSTAVWIFQEGERVSPDQTIRVREKQPSSTSRSTSTTINITIPDKCDIVIVLGIFVFLSPTTVVVVAIGG